MLELAKDTKLETLVWTAAWAPPPVVLGEFAGGGTVRTWYQTLMRQDVAWRYFVEAGVCGVKHDGRGSLRE